MQFNTYAGARLVLRLIALLLIVIPYKHKEIILNEEIFGKINEIFFDN